MQKTFGCGRWVDNFSAGPLTERRKRWVENRIMQTTKWTCWRWSRSRTQPCRWWSSSEYRPIEHPSCTTHYVVFKIYVNALLFCKNNNLSSFEPQRVCGDETVERQNFEHLQRSDQRATTLWMRHRTFWVEYTNNKKSRRFETWRTMFAIGMTLLHFDVNGDAIDASPNAVSTHDSKRRWGKNLWWLIAPGGGISLASKRCVNSRKRR